jgi:hypothetical protein
MHDLYNITMMDFSTSEPLFSSKYIQLLGAQWTNKELHVVMIWL